MSVPGDIELYFFRQRGTRVPPKRYRKQPEELPQSLRYSHLSPKVAAFLANKEKIQSQRVSDDVDGLSKTSLLPEITQSFHHVRGRMDMMLENDEDSQRYLYDEARLSASNVLAQLARFLYTFDEIYTCIPGSLEYLLMMGWKEMTADVVPVPREWQTVAMRETMAVASEELTTASTSLEDQVSTEKLIDSKVLDKTEKLKKRLSKDEDDFKSIELGKKGEKSMSQSQTKPKGTRLNRVRSICGDTADTRSPGSISTIRENSPADLRHFHSNYSMSVIQFQLSSPVCEEKGWIVPYRSDAQICQEEGDALETALKILQNSIKKAKEEDGEWYLSEFNGCVKTKYYGGVDSPTIKYPKQGKTEVNPVYNGQKPQIPDVMKDTGKRVLKSVTSDGSTSLLYPSGFVAILSCQAGLGYTGFYTLAYEDATNSQLLACFTPSGRGVCFFDNGVVRFLVNKRGGHVANSEGTITRKWRWPMGGMKLTTPISIQLSTSLSLRCLSRSNIALVYSYEKNTIRFNVGPVDGARDVKPSDEEQLLTSLSFSSKSATDLNKVVSAKKSTSKTKKKKSKAYVAEVQKLLDDHCPDELDIERDLVRLQNKARILVDDWMDHYRINIGLSVGSLKMMKDEVTVRKRDIQSAKTPPTMHTPLASKTEVQIEAPDPLAKLRAPSAPAHSEVRERLLHRAQTAQSGHAATSGKPRDEETLFKGIEVQTTVSTPRGALKSAPCVRPRPHSLGGCKSACSSVPHSPPSARFDNQAISQGFCPVSLRAELLGFERPLCRCSRHHIPFITDVEYDQFLKTEVSLNQMVIISVVSTLYPNSTPGEIMIEKFHEKQNKNRTRPCVLARNDPFRVLRYDIATAAYESDHTQPMLLARHNIVPGMFLIYQNGKLIFCDNIFNGYGNATKDFKKQMMKCRADAIHGRFLPKDFHFSPGRGRIGRRAAWGGQMGGAGVDHYGNPGICTEDEDVGQPPESSSSTLIQLQVSNKKNKNAPDLRSLLKLANLLRSPRSGCETVTKHPLSSKSCLL